MEHQVGSATCRTHGKRAGDLVESSVGGVEKKRSRLIEFSFEQPRLDRTAVKATSPGESLAAELEEPDALPSKFGYFESPPIKRSVYAEKERTRKTFAIAERLQVANRNIRSINWEWAKSSRCLEAVLAKTSESARPTTTGRSRSPLQK